MTAIVHVGRWDSAAEQTSDPRSAAECRSVAIYIGNVVADAEQEAHIAAHDISLQDVKDLIQWPARPLRAKWEDEEPHGPRLVVMARDDRGRRILVFLDPVPWHDGQSAETWSVRTAFPEA